MQVLMSYSVHSIRRLARVSAHIAAHGTVRVWNESSNGTWLSLVDWLVSGDQQHMGVLKTGAQLMHAWATKCFMHNMLTMLYDDATGSMLGFCSACSQQEHQHARPSKTQTMSNGVTAIESVRVTI